MKQRASDTLDKQRARYLATYVIQIQARWRTALTVRRIAAKKNAHKALQAWLGRAGAAPFFARLGAKTARALGENADMYRGALLFNRRQRRPAPSAAGPRGGAAPRRRPHAARVGSRDGAAARGLVARVWRGRRELRQRAYARGGRQQRARGAPLVVDMGGG